MGVLIGYGYPSAIAMQFDISAVQPVQDDLTGAAGAHDVERILELGIMPGI